VKASNFDPWQGQLSTPPPALTVHPMWVHTGEWPTAEVDDRRPTTIPPAMVDPPTGMSESLTIAPGGGPACVLVEVVRVDVVPVGGFVVELVVDVVVVPEEVVPVVARPVVEVPVDVPVRDDGRVVAEALPVAAAFEVPGSVSADDVPAGAEVPSATALDDASDDADAMVSPATTAPPSPAEVQAARPRPEAPRTTPVTTVRRLKTG
jgi:hypothetical protein